MTLTDCTRKISEASSTTAEPKSQFIPAARLDHLTSAL